ncbi:N(4)-(beta-N-acetylglucosaminyl)-L-asparaginase [Clostridium sp.]|uniref:N(4)-(beta-N-acetylglucosaminyl)-L-asparaginase n=1 Tax=Clostridium sp. TaxID=1506 RepID=UPI0034639B4B
MKWGVIATWRMAIEGIELVSEKFSEGISAGDVAESIVKAVEDYPLYKSVGYGGLPNENCEVELDAAFMDGNSLSIGAVAGIKDFKNPVSIARKLSKEKYNCFLVGQGAEEYAHRNGFERKNMLTKRAIRFYNKRKRDMEDKGLNPYDGHDTVGVIALDLNGDMAAATSTSGLFMKKKGRVGDSPISGSGFYVDSNIGGATATGLGEDLMKGCISYEIVRLMGEGYDPQEAADRAVMKLNHELIKRRGYSGDLSVVCMNNKGQWGVATNIKEFTFSVATYNEKPTVYVTKNMEGKTIYEPASEEWLQNYLSKIHKKID